MDFKWGFIDTFAHKCIIHIRNGNNLGADWDFFPGQPIRVSFPIIPLMVVPANLLTVTVEIIAFLPEILQQLTPIDRVLLHLLKFFLC